MAGQHSSKKNRSGKATTRRRRAIGMGGSTGAFLALSLGPLAHAPAAHADDFGVIDSIIDPLVNSLSSADPALGASMDGWLASLDTALGAASTTDPAATAAASTDLAQLYDQFFYDPSHTFDQQWIEGTSFFG